MMATCAVRPVQAGVLPQGETEPGPALPDWWQVGFRCLWQVASVPVPAQAPLVHVRGVHLCEEQQSFGLVAGETAGNTCSSCFLQGCAGEVVRPRLGLLTAAYAVVGLHQVGRCRVVWYAGRWLCTHPQSVGCACLAMHACGWCASRSASPTNQVGGRCADAFLLPAVCRYVRRACRLAGSRGAVGQGWFAGLVTTSSGPAPDQDL